MFDQAAQIFTALFPIAGVGISITLAFYIIGSFNRAIRGDDHGWTPPAAPHGTLAHEAPREIPPEPKPPSETFNRAELLDWLAEQRRPSNCPQCGAPANRKSDQCPYCGSKL